MGDEPRCAMTKSEVCLGEIRAVEDPDFVLPWNEEAPAPSPARDDAETMIRTILREHTHKLGVCCRCGYGEGEQFAVSEHRHRAHVASVIAAHMAAPDELTALADFRIDNPEAGA